MAFLHGKITPDRREWEKVARRDGAGEKNHASSMGSRRSEIRLRRAMFTPFQEGKKGFTKAELEMKVM